jgi:hypothetical protein
MSRLHDELVAEVEPHENVQDAIKALSNAIADRIEACHGNPVRLTDLKSILREDPAKVARAVTANTPADKQKVKSVILDAPLPTFETPRRDVRQGMINSTNDHRDQQFPENANTETERTRLEREQTAVARGQQVVVNEDLPEAAKADQHAADQRRKAEAERQQREDERKKNEARAKKR